MESELAIEYRGGGGGQEDGQKSQFHSLFFTQAAVIANDICIVERHSNYSEKRNTFERSIIYLHHNCLLSVHVHEAIQHTELDIYFNS